MFNPERQLNPNITVAGLEFPPGADEGAANGLITAPEFSIEHPVTVAVSLRFAGVALV
jgi:hypothetical protein